MKGGSGPLVEEKGISINQTLFSSFWREVEFASNFCRIVYALWISFSLHFGGGRICIELLSNYLCTLDLICSSFWGEVEFASNCCRIVCALWSSFAFAIHSSSHLAQNVIQINMHMFLAQFLLLIQLNLHTSLQINLHAHVD